MEAGLSDAISALFSKQYRPVGMLSTRVKSWHYSCTFIRFVANRAIFEHGAECEGYASTGAQKMLFAAGHHEECNCCFRKGRHGEEIRPRTTGKEGRIGKRRKRGAKKRAGQ
ncbi:Hypothetical protein OINT_2001148 [Brucella intermedia LMG 3301]|uniref:Uncharacterized protein n=1 Tax=Brucella intermedia LMG 3301 TaxID=641118 RepID=C4WNJ7_9HYPH|nr:Hypothetical protein OINT_2001148 [Brucella intermedia LMG 3301]MPR63511.1 hypothetical protein [Brucella intermedia]